MGPDSYQTHSTVSSTKYVLRFTHILFQDWGSQTLHIVCADSQCSKKDNENVSGFTAFLLTYLQHLQHWHGNINLVLYRIFYQFYSFNILSSTFCSKVKFHFRKCDTLTHFLSLLSYQKTRGFLVFSGCIERDERDQWNEMGS